MIEMNEKIGLAAASTTISSLTPMKSLVIIVLLVALGAVVLSTQSWIPAYFAEHVLAACQAVVPDCDAGNSVSAAAAVIGGIWALLSFEHSRRVKTGELLAGLENGVNSSLNTLLRIEDSAAYAEHLAIPLWKSLALTDEPPSFAQYVSGFSPEESQEIAKLEAALRHLHICRHIRGAGSHARSIDAAYQYYLQLIVSDKRPELRDYVRRFWPSLHYWGKRFELNRWQRIWLGFDRRYEKIVKWFKGTPQPLSTVSYGETPWQFRLHREERERLVASQNYFKGEMRLANRLRYVFGALLLVAALATALAAVS